MGEIKKVERVKLFSGLIAVSEDKITESENILQKYFGKIDLQSEVIPFSFTEYYSKEMGENLLRKWVSFEKLIDPEDLADIKIRTNNTEKKLKTSDSRTVNIDPGYMALSKIILASTKDFSHRIYLSKGIFAEITLIFKQKEFTFLPWTYPDYKSETALDFLEKVRLKYHSQVENKT